MRTWGLPTTSWVSFEVLIYPSPGEPSVDTVTTDESLIVTLSEILSQNPPSSATLGFLNLKNWEIIQLCYFKMLSVGVICYAAKYNSLRPQGCSLLAKLERGWNKVSRREHGRWWFREQTGRPALWSLTSNSNTQASNWAPNEVRIQSAKLWAGGWHDEKTGFMGETVQGKCQMWETNWKVSVIGDCLD